MKTKQEIEKIADNYIDNMESRSFWDSFISGYETCQKEYEEKLHWIPVEERLPENREHVLIKVLRSDKSTYIVTGSIVLDSKLGIYWQSGNATQLNVTHWLSLSFL